MTSLEKQCGIFTPMVLHYSIIADPDLRRHELEGLIKGFTDNKTMSVPFEVVMASLEKQWRDWIEAAKEGDSGAMKKALADLRNVAGLVFLKLKETTE